MEDNKQLTIYDKCEKVKVLFPKPAMFDGKEVSELEVRTPIGADIEPFVGKETGAMYTALFAHLACVDEDEVRALSAVNYVKVMSTVDTFLQ